MNANLEIWKFQFLSELEVVVRIYVMLEIIKTKSFQVNWKT